MGKDLKLIVPKGDGKIMPENCKSFPAVCPRCHSARCDTMSGFMKELYLYQIGCKSCGMKVVYTELCGYIAPNDQMVARAQLDQNAQRHIRLENYIEGNDLVRITNNGKGTKQLLS